jgi:hypothetical protein
LSLDPGSQAAIIGVGAAVLLAVGAGIFRYAGFRGDMNQRWSGRVDYTVAALEEKTIRGLELLRGEINEILPEVFDPKEAIADPAPLVGRAEMCAKAYRARDRMERDFAWLLKLDLVLLGGLIAFAIATAAVTVYYAELVHWTWLRLAGLSLLAVSTMALIAAGGEYVWLQRRLSGAEILGDTGGRSEAEQGQ